MIMSFQSKALKLYFQKGNSSKLQPHHVRRIRLLLTALNVAKTPEQMNLPGFRFHSLQPPGSNRYAAWVNGNYRITFRFEGEDAYDVDYVDYH